jgi:hypothetical protein
MLWQIWDSPQRHEPCGPIAMPFTGRPVDLSTKHNYLGRWRD